MENQNQINLYEIAEGKEYMKIITFAVDVLGSQEKKETSDFGELDIFSLELKWTSNV